MILPTTIFRREMMYKIVETFKGIQSEGTHAGTPAYFIRFYGCNLQCKFGAWQCDEPLHTDTKHVTLMSEDLLLHLAKLTCMKHIVITGGEPSMYKLTDLIGKLRKNGHYVQVETNGYSIENIRNANFITYSPKGRWSGQAPFLQSGFHELKLLASEEFEPNTKLWDTVKKKFIQPIADGDDINLDNVKWCVEWVLNHPSWKLSLQTHKWYGGK